MKKSKSLFLVVLVMMLMCFGTVMTVFAEEVVHDTITLSSTNKTQYVLNENVNIKVDLKVNNLEYLEYYYIYIYNASGDEVKYYRGTFDRELGLTTYSYVFSAGNEFSKGTYTIKLKTNYVKMSTAGKFEVTDVACTNHSWDSGVVITAASCKAEGVKKYICAVCGTVKNETIAKTAHTVVKDAAVAATTTSTGLTEGSHCSVCGVVITAQQIIPVISSGATSGWNKVNGVWYYYNSGKPVVSNWQKDAGKWYYFDASGANVTGWKKLDGNWYFFDASGAMVTGWKKMDGKWYYFDGSGANVTSWKKIDGSWYYFDATGAMVTGWKQISGEWYYFASSGEMRTGWFTQYGNTYYLKASGEMVYSTTLTIGGKTYSFNASGLLKG